MNTLETAAFKIFYQLKKLGLLDNWLRQMGLDHTCCHVPNLAPGSAMRPAAWILEHILEIIQDL